MPTQDFKAWSELIRAQLSHGKHNEVLSHFVSKTSRPYGFKPDHLVLQAALKSCALLPAFSLGRSLHSLVIKLGQVSCVSVCRGLLNLYAKAKAFDDCKRMFSLMPRSDTVAWNIVLAGLSGSHVHDADVMSLVYKMHVTGEAEFSSVTAAIVLPVCARLGCLRAGESMHCYAIKSGRVSETLIGNSLVSMYAKCGKIYDGAYPSFCEIDDKDVVSWNAVIAGFAENGFHNEAYKLFRRMLIEPVAPNYITFASILPVCANLDKDVAYSLGRVLHAYAVKQCKLHNNVFVINALMSFYSRMGLFKDAETLFGRMKLRDLISWNAIISGYVSHNEHSRAIFLFQKMVLGKVLEPDSATLVSVIPACSSLKMVKQIHGYILQRPVLSSDTAVSNALINSYTKCDDLNSSCRTFMKMNKRDIISWNSVLGAVADGGCEVQLVSYLNQMVEEGLSPDSITLLTLIRFYGNSGKPLKVREVHGYLLRTCRNQSILMSSSILDAYGKCGILDYSLKIFRILLGEKAFINHNLDVGVGNVDLMVWNLMIKACVCNERPENALSLFLELQIQGMKPDAWTIMSILPVCAKTASPDLLRQCHGYVIRSCIEDAELKGAMIDTYSKCGCITSAAKLFWSISDKDRFMFTGLISGCATHGMGKEALALYEHMLEVGVTPDHVVITVVLSACSRAGLVDEGLSIFHSIDKVHKVKPTMEQYGCVVDLLARNGKVKDAYAFVTKMPVEPNAVIWSILLGACKTYNEVELGQIVADHLFSSENKDIGSCVTMSNIHAADSNWDGVLEIRKFIRSVDFKKPAGCSWV